MEILGYKVKCIFNLFKPFLDCRIVIQSDCTILHTHQKCMSSSCLHSCQQLLLLILAILKANW